MYIFSDPYPFLGFKLKSLQAIYNSNYVYSVRKKLSKLISHVVHGVGGKMVATFPNECPAFNIAHIPHIAHLGEGVNLLNFSTS